MWNISICKYNPRVNEIIYRKLPIQWENDKWQEAEKWFAERAKHPICLYEDTAVEDTNPYLAMVESHRYKVEHLKMKD